MLPLYRIPHLISACEHHQEATYCVAVHSREALSAKDRKPLFSGFMGTGMVEELRTLALYLRELQLREKFGGILEKKYYSINKNQII